MSSKTGHSAHLVNNSFWPILSSMFVLGLVTGVTSFFHLKTLTLLFFSGLGLFLVMFQWWRDVSREGSLLGDHSALVELGLRWGMVLFIISEVMLFLSFFWAFFHSAFTPNIELGSAWPPLGVKSFNPFSIPLLNTIVLLSSGASVTWSHHELEKGNFNLAKYSLLLTIFLGGYFTILQGMEYIEASFNISDSIYGSSFFIATGFHGLHVLVGTLFLAATLTRMMLGTMSPDHCFGFEAAAWYWHFVDVVWLFLYIWLYWWGSI